MSHDTGLTCGCVYEHRPPPLELNIHHVLPIYLGGQDISSNRVTICPTSHANCHEVLRMLLRDGMLTYSQVDAANDRPVSRFAYALAVDGYRRWIAASALTLGAA